MEIIDDVLVAMRRILQATSLHSKFLSKTVGLTVPQLLLLQAVAANPEAPVGQLAKSINLSQATVTTIMDRLEKRGLLLRQRSSLDKRKVHTVLTAEGRHLLASAPKPLQEQFVSQFRNLEAWEQAMILSSLQRVAQMMAAGDIDASPFLDVGDLDRAVQKEQRKETTKKAG